MSQADIKNLDSNPPALIMLNYSISTMDAPTPAKRVRRKKEKRNASRGATLSKSKETNEINIEASSGAVAVQEVSGAVSGDQRGVSLLIPFIMTGREPPGVTATC